MSKLFKIKSLVFVLLAFRIALGDSLPVNTDKISSKNGVNNLKNIEEEISGMNFREDTSSFQTLLEFVAKSESNHQPGYAAEVLKRLLDDNDLFSLPQKEKVLETVARLEFEAGHAGEAIKYLEDYFSLVKNGTDRQKIIRSYANIGMLYRMTGNYKNAVERLIKAIRLTDSLPDSIRIRLSPPILQSLGNLNRSLKQYGQAISYHKQALDMALLTGDTTRIAMIYNDMASALIESGDTAGAKSYYLKAIEINEKNGNVRLLQHNYGNIANIYAGENDFAKNMLYLKKAIDINLMLNDSLQLDNLYHNLSMAYDNTGNIAKALYYEELARDISFKTGNRMFLNDILFHLSELYYRNGNAKTAFQTLKRAYLLHDSLLNGENLKTINELREKYEADKNMKEIELLKKEKEAQRITAELAGTRQKYVIAFSVVLILLLLSSVYYLYEKRKKDKALFESENRLKNKTKLLLEKELENERLQKDLISKELAVKSRQLTSHSLEMIRKNELLTGLLSSVKEIYNDLPQNNGASAKLAMILKNIEHSLSMEKEWELFNNYFRSIDKEFFERLNTHNPKLTVNEMRLCALMKLKMSTKEIAIMLNIKPESVKVAKSRLRKRLGLDSNADICEAFGNS